MKPPRILQPLFAVNSVSPAYANGLKMILTGSLPIIVGVLTGHVQAGLWMALSGTTVTMTYAEGSYRTHAIVCIAATALGSSAMFLAILVGAEAWSAMIFAFFVFGVCGLAYAFGPNIMLVGAATIPVQASVALGFADGSIETAATTLFAGLIGGVWATVIALAGWPFDPWRPIRQTLADGYLALAGFAGNDSGDDSTNAATRQRLGKGLESSRRSLTREHASRPSAPEMLKRLTVFEYLLEHLTNLTTARTAGNDTGGSTKAEREKIRASAAAAGHFLAHRTRPNASGAGNSVDSPPGGSPHLAALNGMLANPDAPLPYLDAAQASFGAAPTRSPGHVFQDVSKDSLVARHALRLGFVAALGTAIFRVFDLHDGFWIPMTIVIVMRPSIGLTLDRGVTRIAGTLVGVIAGGVIAALVSDPLALGLISIPFAFMMAAFAPYNYLYWAMNITVFVIMILSALTPGDWSVAGTRLISTLIGGAMGVLGSLVLWPGRQKIGLPAAVSRTIDANRILLRDNLIADSNAFDRDRRKTATACSNLAARCQDLLTEPQQGRGATDAYIQLSALNRHLMDQTTLLHEERPATDLDPVSRQDLERVLDLLAGISDHLLSNGNEPNNDSHTSDSTDPQVVAIGDAAQQMLGLARQVRATR